MVKHTPGPWRVEIGDESADYAHQFPIIVSNDFEVVGTEGFYSGELAIDVANATLAAASPELLDALKDALCALEVCGRDFDHVVGKARAAIAKAEG